ncbi:MAG TPA: hypothetical protein VHO03_13965 [Ignavibacteriales bacterium]|nr:hypothetical protein [Ignavibacteriales bacterium]
MLHTRNFAAMLFVMLLAVLTTNALAQDQTGTGKSIKHGAGFIDANGDGYNDNAPDIDGDGIPNGQDPDFTGPKARRGHGGMRGFVDANGDGINDNALDSDGDGIPNGKDPDFVRPQNGQGRKMGMGRGNGQGKGYGLKGGAQGTGTGVCDGTGPKGNRSGK